MGGRIDGSKLPSDVTLTMVALQHVDKDWEDLSTLQLMPKVPHFWVWGGKFKPRKLHSWKLV